MPGTQASSIPFTIWKLLGSTHSLPLTQRLLEKASLSIKRGTPVVLSSGYTIERTAIDGVTKVVAGVLDENAHNISTDGTAPLGGSGSTYGSVPNQASAVNVAIGSPMADGTIGVLVASDENVFVGKTDDAHTLAVTDVGSIFGLTKDSASGFWFVDTTITTAAGGACIEVVEAVDAIGTVGGRVAFRFTHTYQQLFV